MHEETITGARARLERFRSTSYFPELDGMRTISVALVIAFHTGDAIWRPVHGYLGVTVFFVLSGFLITTLLLRQEARDGRVAFGRFYVRRTLRIFPLYYVALALNLLLVVGFGMGQDPHEFLARLPLLATYNGEFAGSGTFSHSWSLGIEEKFYLVWPALGFALAWARRHRSAVAITLLALSSAAALFPATEYFAIYAPILAGAVVAILMHGERATWLVAALAHPAFGIPLLLLTGLALVTNDESGYVHVPFALLVALGLPFFVVGPRIIRSAIGWAPLAFLGTRSYGMYLFHPIAMSAVFVIAPAGSSVLEQSARLLLAGVASYLVAEAMYRLVERPLIALGRRITGSASTSRGV